MARHIAARVRESGVRREYTACLARVIRSEWYADQREVHMTEAQADQLAGTAMDAIGGDLCEVLRTARHLLEVRSSDSSDLEAWTERMDAAQAAVHASCRAPLQNAVWDMREERLQGGQPDALGSLAATLDGQADLCLGRTHNPEYTESARQDDLGGGGEAQETIDGEILRERGQLGRG